MSQEKVSKLQSFFNTKNQSEQEVYFEWKNIKYWVKTKDSKRSKLLSNIYNTKKVLNNLSGYARSGELLAIMGPTGDWLIIWFDHVSLDLTCPGCGKTSLLNCLAARMPSAGSKDVLFTGQVLVNGKQRVDAQFRKISAYVMQVRLHGILSIPWCTNVSS